ncbi:DNA replication protein [Leuconostoc gelidum subsp. gasicomitatum]|nr:DNA replication protein [Leuconostoc gasicomitatum]MBZ5973052.1 DNA replication protein [Leuconostoc gasicomitatum]
MLSKKVTDTDIFLDMPLSAQALYFHLNMHADDDGFIDNAKTVQRMIGSNGDDLKLLLAKQFLLPFDSGVVVIKDWRVHNYIQNDRYNKTQYIKEKEQLVIEENNTYTKCVQDVSKVETQVRLGKDRLGKDSKDILSDSDEPDRMHIEKSERDEMFEEIWKLYPKKSGKSNAKKDFDKAIKAGVDSELIKSKLQEYLKQIEIKQTPGQYIKQGSTWFHQAGWEDEYDFTPEVKQTYGRAKREGVVPSFLKNKGLING